MENLVKIRAKAIRNATPDCIEELFEMQNRICDLCGHPIQDLVFADLDHSIPVIRYARCLDIVLEDAVRECNHSENLRVAHTSCNRKKHNLTRDEWYERGSNNQDTPQYYTAEEIEKFRRNQDSKLQSIKGKIGGRKAVENKLGIFSLEFDNGSGGRVSGRNNAKSGHLQKISSSGGKVSGKISGRKNAESGHCARIAALGGAVAGKKTGLRNCHLRWHVNRGIISQTCELCLKVN